MLKVIDGLRMLYNNAAHNCTPDIPAQSVAANVNSTSIDMSNFGELLVVGLCNAVTGSGTGVIAIQESNESAANFTNVTNASMAFNTANSVRMHSVDWRNPARKRYARLNALNTTNAITLAAVTLRVRPENVITLANNAGQLDS